ncbi:MAG: hypothetical protein N4A63_16040 [Vallitalea sp.]|jgi:Ca2+/Na+ antiporter|nr:hypothetical protein [Vallitalea sp.]
MKKYNNILTVILINVIILLVHIIYIYPHKKYSQILNYDNYFAFNGILLIVFFLITFKFFRKSSKLKKSVFYLCSSIVLSTIMITYYYSKLPSYTYIEAAKKVESLENTDGNTKTLLIPKYSSYKIAEINCKYLDIIHSIYYIYLLDSDQNILVYRFDPIKGIYEIKHLKNFDFTLEDFTYD